MFVRRWGGEGTGSPGDAMLIRGWCELESKTHINKRYRHPDHGLASCRDAMFVENDVLEGTASLRDAMLIGIQIVMCILMYEIRLKHSVPTGRAFTSNILAKTFGPAGTRVVRYLDGPDIILLKNQDAK